MKNLLVILFFSIFSLFSLVVMIFLIFLPKLCDCLNVFCNKNYKTIKKQNTRARRIKRARLRLLFKKQISHEQPTQKELDRSEGVFFDEETQQRILDEGSLTRFNEGQLENLSVKDALFKALILLKHRFQLLLVSMQVLVRETVLPNMRNKISVMSDSLSNALANGNIKSKIYYGQLRSNLSASIDKYFISNK